MLGHVALSELTRRHGTPLYVYDAKIIRKKYSQLRAALPDNLQIYYAVKANPNHEILQIMASLYDGFDVASRGEAKRAIDAGVRPENISFAGPGKTTEELLYAVEHNITLSIESRQEYRHISRICTETGRTATVVIRVNPDFELSGSGMKMGGGSKKFGVDSELVPDLIKDIDNQDMVAFKGIHIFSGSQNLQAEELLKTFEKIVEYAVELQSETGVVLQQLNMGGGLGIPYYAHEQELDIEKIGTGLKKIFKKTSSELRHTVPVIELGRYTVGECGVYLSRILYRKESRGEIFIVTDGGLHHHLAATGNLGQSLVRRPMPVTVANRQGSPLEKVHVVGPLCTPLDSFGFVELPESREGDIVAVLQSGAYGFSASPQLFLTHPVPKEVTVNL